MTACCLKQPESRECTFDQQNRQYAKKLPHQNISATTTRTSSLNAITSTSSLSSSSAPATASQPHPQQQLQLQQASPNCEQATLLYNFTCALHLCLLPADHPGNSGVNAEHKGHITAKTHGRGIAHKTL